MNVTRDGSLGAVQEHVCFSYDDDAALSGRARSFLADGAAAGSRMWWIGDSSPPEGFDAHVLALGAAYPNGVVVDPDAQVRTYAAATGAALAAGFTGLRVVAEATPGTHSRAARHHVVMARDDEGFTVHLTAGVPH